MTKDQIKQELSKLENSPVGEKQPYEKDDIVFYPKTRFQISVAKKKNNDGSETMYYLTKTGKLRTIDGGIPEPSIFKGMTPEEIEARMSKIIFGDKKIEECFKGSFRFSDDVEGIYESIIQESKFLNEQQGKMEWDCAYIRLPQEITDQIQKWIGINIPHDWVYESTVDRSFGIEQESHCTLLYGLDPMECDYQKVQQKMIENAFQPIRFSLEEIGMFPTNEGYVVLKMEAQGKDLHHIHDFLKNTFKNHDSHPIYNPHCTLCYIKKEHEQDIKQFIGDRIFRVCDMTAKSFIYSDQGNHKHEVKLVAEQIEGAKDADKKISV